MIYKFKAPILKSNFIKIGKLLLFNKFFRYILKISISFTIKLNKELIAKKIYNNSLLIVRKNVLLKFILNIRKNIWITNHILY